MKARLSLYFALAATAAITVGIGVLQRAVSDPPSIFLDPPPLAINPDKANQDPLTRDYAVYSAVLEHYGSANKLTGPIVIDSLTSSEALFRSRPEMEYTVLGLARDLASYVGTGTLEDFLAHNSSPGITAALRPDFRSARACRLVDREVLKRFFTAADPWNAFHQRFPSSPGIMTFSRVGFNETGNEAMMYAEWNCGSLCGDGTYFVLEKQEGFWSIARTHTRWVS